MSPTLLSLYDMVSCLGSALDLVSPVVVDHQKKTAYIARSLARELGAGQESLARLILAGLLHDCGALSLRSKLDALRFDLDTDNPQQHAELGYGFLRQFERLFPEIAKLSPAHLVRYHHVPWRHGEGAEFLGQPVPRESHLLHLADRVEVLTRASGYQPAQAGPLLARLGKEAGRLFVPELVEAFAGLAAKEAFWFNLRYGEYLDGVLAADAGSEPALLLDLAGVLKLARVFSQIVDFRSRFTSTHSAGVAAVATALAGLAGFSEQEIELIRVAGYLHDLGKLAVPAEILEKPGPLTPDEFDLVKEHPFHLHRLLGRIPAMQQVVAWAPSTTRPWTAGLPLPSPGPRALPGRPHRGGGRRLRGPHRGPALPARPAAFRAVDELRRMVKTGRLDPRVVDLAVSHRGEVDQRRESAQREVADSTGNSPRFPETLAIWPAWRAPVCPRLTRRDLMSI